MKITNCTLIVALLIGITQSNAYADGCDVQPPPYFVYPSGGDDTANLQAIFDQVAGIQGVCVQLEDGLFSISQTLLVSNFDGEINGRGADLTIIRTGVPSFPPGPPGLPLAGMVAIVHSAGDVAHISISDIGFEFDSVPEPDAVFGALERSIVSIFGGGEVDAHFSDLSMTGNAFVRAGIEPWGDHGDPLRFLRGSVTVVRSTFRDMVEAVNTQAFAGNLVIGGSEDDGNFAEDVTSLIFTHDFDGATINVSYNEVHAIGASFDFGIGISINNGLGAVDGSTVMPEAPSTIWVHSNQIDVQGDDVSAIGVFDNFSRVGIDPQLSGQIEANNISGTGYLPVLTESTQNIEIINNFVTGNWVYGINPWLVSNGCTITGNVLGETEDGQKLGMSSLFGAISVEESNNCNVSGNRFVKVSSPGLGAVWISGQFNKVENNDYTESGLPGWNVIPGAIMLANFTGSHFNSGSKKNHVFETNYPAGTDVCEQVQGIQGNNVQALIDGTVAGVNPGMCSAVLSLKIFNQSNAHLLQQMTEMQEQREEAWSRSRRVH